MELEIPSSSKRFVFWGASLDLRAMPRGQGRGGKLTLFVNTELDDWVEHLERAPGSDGVNRAFDPRYSPLTSENSFWLGGRTSSGETVVCMAIRSIWTDDLLTDLRTMSFWGRSPEHTDHQLELIVPTRTPAIAGHIVHVGGLWVHPDHRGDGAMSLLMSRLGRVFVLGGVRPDWVAWFSFEKIASSARMRSVWGAAETVPLFDGYFPPSGRMERMYLSYFKTALRRTPSCRCSDGSMVS